MSMIWAPARGKIKGSTRGQNSKKKGKDYTRAHYLVPAEKRAQWTGATPVADNWPGVGTHTDHLHPSGRPGVLRAGPQTHFKNGTENEPIIPVGKTLPCVGSIVHVLSTESTKARSCLTRGRILLSLVATQALANLPSSSSSPRRISGGRLSWRNIGMS